MQTIPVNDFIVRINQLWMDQWFLLTCGDYQKRDYNTMTVAWGYFGVMWNKPCAVVVVRPTRHTFEFMNKYNTFTLCSFDKKYKDDLRVLGTKSGRDGDKIAETGLIVMPSVKVPAPGFEQAELIIECNKIYWQDFDPANFLDAEIERKYPLKDYHRMYFGEIVEIRADASYLFKPQK